MAIQKSSKRVTKLLCGLLMALVFLPKLRAEVIFSESFEGPFPPLWTRGDNSDCSGGVDDYWGRVDCMAQSGNRSAWCAAVHGHNEPENVCDHYYNCQAAFMTTDEIDITDYCNVQITFYWKVSTQNSNDNLRFDRSQNGTNWDLLLNEGGNQFSNWHLFTHNIPSSWTTLHLRWRFNSDGSGWEYPGAFVDNIVVTGTPRLDPQADFEDPDASDDLCDRIRVTWLDYDNATGYRIFRNGVQVGQVGAGVEFFDDYPPAGTYSYSLQIFNSCGNGGFSAVPATGTRLGPPSTVPALQLLYQDCDSAAITWNLLDPEFTYAVFMDGDLVESDLDSSERPLGVDLTPGDHCFTIRAANGCGNGQMSSELCIHGPAPQNSPSLAVDSVDCESIFLAWTEVADADSYVLYRDGAVLDNQLTLDDVPFEDFSPPAGLHCYAISAANACGEGSLSSPPACAQTVPPPASAPAVFIDSIDCESIFIGWNALAGAAEYAIYRDGALLADLLTMEDMPFEDDLPLPGVNCYAVSAFNDCGEGPLSSPVCAEVVVEPLRVTGVSAVELACDLVQITWHQSNDVELYDVYRTDDPLFPICTTEAGDTVCYDDFVDQGSSYTYFVVASNDCGESPSSSPAAASVPLCFTSPDSLVVAYDHALSGIVLHWSPSLDEFGDPTFDVFYEVHRGTEPDFAPDANTLLGETATTTWSDLLQVELTQAYYLVIAKPW